MSDENTMKSKKGKAIKIIVPVLLLCIVVGIWSVKNLKEDIKSVGSDNPDFALNVTEKVDLEKLKSYGVSRRPSGLRKTKHSTNSLAHRTTWLRSDFCFCAL